MKNKQEVWTAMIISGYSKKLGITITKHKKNTIIEAVKNADSVVEEGAPLN